MKCYACDKPMQEFMRSQTFTVETEDGQRQFVGPDCFERIRTAGAIGYQPPLGGPRLFKIGALSEPLREFSNSEEKR